MNKKTGETDASFARWKETLNGLKDTTANMLDNLGTQGGNLFAPAAAEGLRQLNDVLKLLSDNFDTVASGAVVLGSGIAGMTAAKKLAANETARYAAETIKLEAAQLRGKVTLLGSAQAVAMKAQADTEAALAARNAARAELERFEAERRSALAVQMARVHIVYEAGRDNDVRDFVEKSKLLPYLKGIGNSRANLIRYTQYLEALVAYHRYMGGKEN